MGGISRAFSRRNPASVTDLHSGSLIPNSSSSSSNSIRALTIYSRSETLRTHRFDCASASYSSSISSTTSSMMSSIVTRPWAPPNSSTTMATDSPSLRKSRSRSLILQQNRADAVAFHLFNGEAKFAQHDNGILRGKLAIFMQQQPADGFPPFLGKVAAYFLSRLGRLSICSISLIIGWPSRRICSNSILLSENMAVSELEKKPDNPIKRINNISSIQNVISTFLCSSLKMNMVADC